MSFWHAQVAYQAGFTLAEPWFVPWRFEPTYPCPDQTSKIWPRITSMVDKASYWLFANLGMTNIESCCDIVTSKDALSQDL